jgi:hypothetical protein
MSASNSESQNIALSNEVKLNRNQKKENAYRLKTDRLDWVDSSITPNRKSKEDDGHRREPSDASEHKVDWTMRRKREPRPTLYYDCPVVEDLDFEPSERK